MQYSDANSSSLMSVDVHEYVYVDVNEYFVT